MQESTTDHAQRIADQAPPLTGAQRDRLAALIPNRVVGADGKRYPTRRRSPEQHQALIDAAHDYRAEGLSLALIVSRFAEDHDTQVSPATVRNWLAKPRTGGGEAA